MNPYSANTSRQRKAALASAQAKQATGTPDPAQEERLEQMTEAAAFLANQAYSLRKDFFKLMMDPRRNYEAECGWPEETRIDAKTYQSLHDRLALANRVVSVLPRETWQVTPEVFELEESDEATPFERAWDALSKNLAGHRSFFRKAQGSPIWEALKRADEQSRIGSFGIILLGLDDIGPGRTMMDPVSSVVASYDYLGDDSRQRARMDKDPADPNAPDGGSTPHSDMWDSTPTGYMPAQLFDEPFDDDQNPDTPVRPMDDRPDGQVRRKLVFLRVFPSSLVQISRYDRDPASPRYCQPVQYLITFVDPNLQQAGAGMSVSTQLVHWTRVVHVADNLTSSEWFGVPAMQPVINNLIDLKKLYGGSAEMYWRGAFPGLSIETQPELGGDVLIDEQKVREKVEDYTNGLDRFLMLMGLQAKTLAPTVVDPSPQIRVQIEAICICLGIPLRIFMGSERGELASTQDDSAWNDRLKLRQETHVTPKIIVPFIDRLIDAEVLPRPTEVGDDGDLVGYSIEWPDLTSKSDQEKASTSLTITQALAAYISGNVEGLIAPMEFLTRVLSYTPEAAEAIIASTMKNLGSGGAVDGSPGNVPVIRPGKGEDTTVVEDQSRDVAPGGFQ